MRRDQQGERVPDCGESHEGYGRCRVHRGHSGAHMVDVETMWYRDGKVVYTPEEWYERHPA